LLIACLLFCAAGSQAVRNTNGNNGGGSSGTGNVLTLTTITSQLLEGTFVKGNVAIDFSSRPGALTISVLGTPLLSVCDFGAFLKVSLGGRIFLVASAPDIVFRVIDITSSICNLPNLDGSELLSLTANLDIFKQLLVGLPITNLLQCEKRLADLMVDLTATVELELIIDLSIELALRGINGYTHLCVQPIHLTALRLLKLRADINLDVDLIARANARVSIDANVTIPGSCDLVNTCGNKCLGLCGVNCNCFKWVCGGCDGFAGCRSHDCSCDCKGTRTWACVSLAVTRCSGVHTGCVSAGLLELDLLNNLPNLPTLPTLPTL